MEVGRLCDSQFVFRGPYLQVRLRQSGIGSLPSAIRTVCAALTATGSTVFDELLGIALYIPANAKAVSRTWTNLLMGESPNAQRSRAPKYSPILDFCVAPAVKNEFSFRLLWAQKSGPPAIAFQIFLRRYRDATRSVRA
jgi:hypothetical protein